MRLKTIFWSIILFGLIGALIWAYLKFGESNPPQLTLLPQTEYISLQTKFSIQTKDLESDLKSVSVDLVQQGQSYPLFKKIFEPETKSWVGSFHMPLSKIKNGAAELFVTVTDKSFNNWGKGNMAVLQRNVVVDTIPPRISVLSNAHNVNQGGSGLIVYSLSEPVEKTGVKVGQRFFPAYKDNNKWLCMFAFPYDANPDTDSLQLIAADKAGNIARTGFNQHIRSKKFKHDNINISSGFLNSNMPEFRQYFPQEQNMLGLFLRVNKQLRAQNRATLYKLGKITNPKILWKGRFLRQPNSSTRATFGDKRSYYNDGKEIDNQTHLGVDLASIAKDKVVACNAGEIILAESMGIYGQVVIIDHGLGLQSLYAHLSQINVKPGDTVKKGDIIGRTGSSGLAGGDHLHLGILVSGQPVNPVEWWDASWIRNNITSKL